MVLSKPILAQVSQKAQLKKESLFIAHHTLLLTTSSSTSGFFGKVAVSWLSR